MQSLETFRAFFEASPDAIIVINYSGQIIMVSNRVKTTFGYEPEEIIGQEIEMLLPESLQQKHKEHRNEYLKTPKIREMGKGMELQGRRKDGSVFYAEISLSPINVKERVILASVRDVSERRELYRKLKITSDEFRGAFEHSAIGMALVSIEGKWLKVNQRVCEIVGYPEEELLVQTFQDITHPDDLNKDLELVGKVLTGEIESYQMEKRYFHKNGSTVWVLLSVSLARDSDGTPRHFVSQIKDITKSKEDEKALRESEQRWQFALEGSGDGVWDWQLEQGTVYFSPRWKQMLGYAENEIGNSYAEWGDRVHPEDRERRLQLIGDLLTGEKHFYMNELRLQKKDGEYLWVLARGKVIERDSMGKPLRIIGTHSDISWQKEKETELRESFDIISEQNKRLMNFAHIVSHNLRSHSGNFQLILNLLENAETDEEREQMESLLRDNAQSLSDTIKHLNDVVQIQVNRNMKKEPINLKHYVQKTIDILAGEINQHNVSIINNVNDNTQVLYNPAYMESILLNFISNGIKYRHPERTPEIKLETSFDKNRLILHIADNGRGINLERYGNKLFGLYKTFHGNVDAKGVGLFITKNQVDAMGGKIEVDSWVDLGTTFKIYLS